MLSKKQTHSILQMALQIRDFAEVGKTYAVNNNGVKTEFTILKAGNVVARASQNAGKGSNMPLGLLISEDMGEIADFALNTKRVEFFTYEVA